MTTPLRWNKKQNDLVLKFDNAEVVDTLRLGTVAGQKVQLMITGRLTYEFGRMPFMGTVVTKVVQ